VRPLTRLAIRAPDHLGDGVMALPAISALVGHFPVTVHAPGWGRELYAGLDVRPGDAPPEGDVGVLFKPSWHAAWSWRALPRRIGVGRSLLLTDPVPPGGHRRDEYARIAAVMGVEAVGLPAFAPRGRGPTLPSGYVGLNPWSPSPTVRWPYFRDLADRLDRPVFFAGPGEGAAVRAIAGPHAVVEGLTLAEFAGALQGCRLFISNDSGAAHFAAACGVRVRVIHGSTTGPRTGVGEAVEGPELHCRPCYRKRCPYALECLTGIPVERVL
jgi:ADP-heptose:LPS heptosyltransferase